MKLDYCYHTHTYRCGHAKGTDEEYVLNAIKMGIKRLGFSDHIIFKDLKQPGIRANIDMLEDYLSSIKALKEKYKDQIDIIIGFEAEYYDEYKDYYQELLDKKVVDYLILGQHFYLENGRFNRYFYKDAPIKNAVKYTNDLVKGIKSGLFTYVAHPDLFINPYKKWTFTLIRCAKKILKACEEMKVPIEVNIGGFRWKYAFTETEYPSKVFFELSKKYDVDVVIGVDAHNPVDFNLEDSYKALEFVKDHNLRYIEDYKISDDK